MNFRQFAAACLCLAGALAVGHVHAQSYLGAGDLGSIRQTNQSPAVSPMVSAVGGAAPGVTDAQSASASINRAASAWAASDAASGTTGSNEQERSATARALDTRNLQHPRQTRSFDSIARPSRPE
ncbi:hypothetical protein [Pandoraea pulmonicola]|uniref:DUF4148 domain-containing protein n=1 Tax=Pandoraea pulmonicola TaxID=93221 RepID=A0AAJ5D2R7_PANPU|nr:hypothetical protein [Pandoraea pulmonicola]SUA93113.1 Uncharacterised protein [Pandoraea pulmonicola]